MLYLFYKTMCGIFGITSTSENIVPLLTHNLKYLSYRGYDSTGICLSSPLTVYKAVGNVEKLGPINDSAHAGIGHTRWATHGKKSRKNAHPHLSHNHVAIVHNGIINNYLEIKALLIQQGYLFVSETDSEVIAHLLHQQLQHLSPLKALEKMQSILQGRYAFIALIESYPNIIFGLSNNLSLLVGENKNSFSIASDLIALKHCHAYAKAPNLTPFYITSTETSLKQPFWPMPSFSEELLLEKDITYHEILSQHTLLSQFSNWKPLQVPKPKHIMFIACGSSFHCAELAHYWFQEQGIVTTLETASELKSRKLYSLQDTLIIAISQSGETADTLICMESILKEKHLHSITITNSPTSSLANLSQTVIPLNIGIERGVASTKAVTAQMLVLFNLAQQFKEIPETIPCEVLSKAILDLYYLPNIVHYAKKISQYQHVLCLGSHTLLPVAKECALKIKELAYIHAEALPRGELKHGPLALIDQDTFCIVLGSKNCIATQTCISEINARGGSILAIGYGNTEGIDIPNIPNQNHIVINIACQLLSYHIAKILERSIDQPRNLAKSVTVE